MRVEYDGHLYFVSFRHETWRRLTICHLEMPDQVYAPQQEVETLGDGCIQFLRIVAGSVAEGLAHVHPADGYCKATGRRLALRRAIQHLPRATRTAIWAVYHSRGR
jgi:hypothetical protein